MEKAESIKSATRVFKYEDKMLPDTAPGLPAVAVLKHYSAIHAELINGTVVGPKINKEKQLEYEFKLEIGTKG